MSSITLLLLLCLSTHACNARFLGIVLEKSVGKQSHIFNKDIDKTQILGHSALKTQVQKEIGENTLKEEESKGFLKEEAASNSETSGDHIMVSCQNDSQRLARKELLQSSRGRYLLGLSQDDTNEAVGSKENDFVENTVVMDYAQPHRKPPIHNEKP